MYNDNFLDRKERLKEEGKIELPLAIDTKKYLVANISFYDLLIIGPFLVLGIIAILVFHHFGMLSKNVVIFSLVPASIVCTFQLIKHPVRKNLSFIQFAIIWKIKYRNRVRDFYYKKGDIDMSNKDDQDVRKELGIKNVFAGCFETTDNRFVKVIEVSSINISLMNKSEKRSISESYRNFLSEMQFLKSMQISQIAQPINLTQYLLYIDKKTASEKDSAKRMLNRSYKKYVENIQKSRNMVARKRYIMIDQPISTDREKALSEIERKASLIKNNIENMLRGHGSLQATVLQNDELIKLMYTCLDYDNAQALGEYITSRAKNSMSLSMGELTAREVISSFEKQLSENIN